MDKGTIMMLKTIRRVWAGVLGLALGVTVAASVAPVWAQQAPSVIRVGWSLAKSGPNAPGGDTTIRPNYEIWVKEVNEAGGLMLSAYGKRVPIEVVEYDDRSSTEEAVRNIERLIAQDKVDLLLAPWGTATNLAVSPTFDRYGYPQLGSSNVTDKADQFARRWPTHFFLLGTARMYAAALMEVLQDANRAGQISRRIALISVADGFGVDSAVAFRQEARAKGFELVMDKTYPVGSNDLSSLLSEAKALDADTFVAFSYPPDTILISDQARVVGLNPKVFYTGVGTAYPFFKTKYGSAGVEGLMSLGGIDGDSPAMRNYRTRHLEVTGREPDYWGSAVTYASLQMLQQSIEKVGRIDRAAILAELKSATFDTILGPIKLENNQLRGIFTVGQWQNGVFQGVAPKALKGAKPAVIPKAAW